MLSRIANTLDYDLDLILGAGSPGTHTHHFGFDPETRFCMLGVSCRVQFSIVGDFSESWSFVADPPTGVLTIIDVDMTFKGWGKRGLITIEGAAIGQCELSIRDGPRKLDAIQVKVVPNRRVVTRFYNLSDAVHVGVTNPDPFGDPNFNKSPLFSADALNELIDQINGIVFSQSYVMMAQSGTGMLRDASVAPRNLGDFIDADDPGVQAALTTPSGSDPDASYHIFFVWGIKGDRRGGHTNGSSASNFTLLDATLSGTHRIITVAHEFVHFLSDRSGKSHDAKHSDLMFQTYPHGIEMRKDRLLRIIRT